jgi:hypothetical protein
LGCAISIGLSVWTAEAGGWIRHLEFRSAPKSTPTPAPSVPMASPSATPLPIPTASVAPDALPAPAGSGSVTAPAAN